MQLSDSTPCSASEAFIDGDWRDARGGDVIPVSSPASETGGNVASKWGGRGSATPSTP